MVNTASNKQFAAALLCLLLPGQALAGDWKLDPTLSVSERYTDNITLDATGQESSFITEVSPGIKFSRKGGRVEAHVNYTLQGLFYSHDSDANDFRNQLNAGLRAELIEEHFFLNADARIGQQNISSLGKVGTSNYNITGNRTETRSFSITPSWRSRFGTRANFDARWQLSYSESDSAGAVPGTTGSNFRLGLTSGSAYQKTPWGVSYAMRSNDGATSTNVTDLNAHIGYIPSPKIRYTLTAGIDDNNRNTTGFNNASGGYLTLGAAWSPTNRTRVEGNIGRRYNGNSYGLNLSHRSRKTNWALRYSESIVDTYSQLSGLGFEVLYSCGIRLPYGSPPPADPDCQDAVALIPVSVTNITPDVTLSKTWSGTMVWRLGKSTLSSGIHKSSRELLTAGTSDDHYGVNASWLWRLSSRDTSTLSMYTNHASTAVSDSDYWSIAWDFSRKLSQKTTGSLEIRHLEGDPSSGAKYEENAISARIRTSF